MMEGITSFSDFILQSMYDFPLFSLIHRPNGPKFKMVLIKTMEGRAGRREGLMTSELDDDDMRYDWPVVDLVCPTANIAVITVLLFFEDFVFVML